MSGRWGTCHFCQEDFGPPGSQGVGSVCLPCIKGISALKKELAEKDAEIARLKQESSEKDAEIERLEKEAKSSYDDMICVWNKSVEIQKAIRSRSRAWKRCAKMWRDDLYMTRDDWSIDSFYAHRFERVDGKFDTSDWATTTITKAPPDWRTLPEWVGEGGDK